MEQKLNLLENFFDCDIRIKNIIFNIGRNLDFIITSDDLVEYEDNTLKTLEELEYYLCRMTRYAHGDWALEEFNQFFSRIKQVFLRATGNKEMLRQVYKNCISDMREEFIEATGASYCAYSLFNGPADLKPVSINEYLHDLHVAVMNNESTFLRFPPNDKVEALKETGIFLRGLATEMALDVAIALVGIDPEAYNDETKAKDVLGLKNKVLIMARDIGHATTIELTADGDWVSISYFIPKVTNYLMVNELRGLTEKVKPGAEYARGTYSVSREQLPYEIRDLVSKIPTDKHMRVPGGAFYEGDLPKVV